MNFKDTKRYVKTINKIDGHRFDNVNDFTNMIDLLNKETEEKTTEEHEDAIHDVSKYILRNMNTSTTFLGDKA